MTTLQTGLARLRYAGDLISQGTDQSPQSGVWLTRITRAALLANILMWVALIGVFTLAWSLLGRPAHLWVLITLVVCGKPISIASLVVGALLDKYPDRPPSTSVFLGWAALTAVLGLPLAHLLLFYLQQIQALSDIPLLARFFPECFLALVIVTRYWRLVIIRLWYERLETEKLKGRAAEQGRVLAETRLHMLEAQIEPHFLFNSLASVQHLVRADPAQADFLLAQLISYLRQAIPDVRGTASTLGREFDLIQTYLDIVRVRMGGRLTVGVRCDPALAEVPFPALIIHTLVENAIKHGVEMKPGPVNIAVRARPVSRDGQEWVEIRVEDDGAGLGASDTPGGGLGLRNIGDRLALAYQGRARLELSAAPGGGVRATVSVPAA